MGGFYLNKVVKRERKKPAVRVQGREHYTFFEGGCGGREVEAKTSKSSTNLEVLLLYETEEHVWCMCARTFTSGTVKKEQFEQKYGEGNHRAYERQKVWLGCSVSYTEECGERCG